jgi:hypothetical protein
MMSSRESATSESIRLISQFQPALLGYILTLYPNHADPQDILQETNVVVVLSIRVQLYQPLTSSVNWTNSSLLMMR